MGPQNVFWPGLSPYPRRRTKLLSEYDHSSDICGVDLFSNDLDWPIWFADFSSLFFNLLSGHIYFSYLLCF